ncbi:MAG: YkvA family protein [Brevinematia bacterium]
MKIIDRLKERSKALKKEIKVIYFAYQNPDLNLLPKIIIVITLGYALSPVDLIPDFIPVLGYLDDLIIIPALIILSLRLIPKDIIKEARARAERENIFLRKNWVAGIIFILIWLSLLGIIFFKIFCFF